MSDSAITYYCTYTKEFPVDEYGRLGGLYSLVDIPIAMNMKMTRDGIIEAKNSKQELYKVRDVENNFTEWVPVDDVVIGERTDA